MEITQEQLQKAVNEQKPEVKQEKPAMRELVILTDGASIHLAKNEWTNLEMLAGLTMLLNKLQNK
jgi:hypothetical protein